MTYQPSEARHDALAWRRAGSSGLTLPEFSFGLWQKFGDRTPYETQREILLGAFEAGITHFDNANRYGPPHRAAEKNLGRLLRQDLGAWREEILISSKAGNPIGKSPYLRGGSRKSLLQSLDHSLRDLGTDYVDIFYFHHPDPATPIEETVGALVTAVQSGKALYVGISNFYSRAAAHEAALLLRQAGVPLVAHQPRYSIFDRRIEIEGILEQSAEDGVGLITYSPLAQGLLTDKYLDSGIPAEARAASSDFLSPSDISEDYRVRARALNDLALERGQSLAQLALQWVLRRPEVTSALIGASSVEQLHHNLRAPGFTALTAEELAVIDTHGVHGTGLRL
ncbi:L-glyceraldehyde 3-phosphate reductase [Microbacterium terrae]|uniref:L-glyceraldehyde 3-phosphate reductase n=1 Tax=Microbacterium terrae TaxID=69369 RepID=A0A0M2HFA9_9MICO|nr:aldo/keto reductase [Microbacterium terrae]KJL45329.1 L-glyceraldehyde 3-phosphate reductase [Microbacterium terrae]MBP1078423.1 L-glyceraldehyde 3-phosphate reductase [Microbacterium terrae]GLJ99323.1 aldo/keto reductase [Microbacterium terrae]